MFEGAKQYLENLTPKQLDDLRSNLITFNKLKTLLEAKGIIKVDKMRGDIEILKDGDFVDAFIVSYKKLTLRGVKIIDKRSCIKK